MTHESARRVESWIVLEDCTLPFSETMALEDLHGQEHHTRVSYADGRCYLTVASRRSIFRAMRQGSDADDAVTFTATIGTPRELPTKE